MLSCGPAFFGGIAGVIDTDFSSVVQLAHFDGTHGSTTLTNSCSRGNTMAVLGSTISTTQSLYGGASLRCNTGSTAASAASHADYGYGTGDFTIEWRMRIDTVNLGNVFDQRANGPVNTVAPTIYTLANGTLSYYVNGVDRITSATGVIVTATWQAVAACRIGTSTKLFVDGTQVGSTYTDSNDYVQEKFTIGRGTNSSAPMAGVYFEELRITKGIGRYSGNYTVATEAFPNS